MLTTTSLLLMVTFHGMGLIAAITPGRNIDRIIPRGHYQPRFCSAKKISVIEYHFVKRAPNHRVQQPAGTVTEQLMTCGSSQ